MELIKKYATKHGDSLDPAQLQGLEDELEDVIDGLHLTLPMKCEAAECPFASRCPLYKRRIAPKGELCPIEQMVIEHSAEMLRQTLGIDPQNYVEMSMVRDYIEAEVLDRRASNYLSLNNYFDLQAVGVDREGNAIVRKEEGIDVQIKLKFQKRKDDLRRMFMATREVKAKYKLSENLDASKLLAIIRGSIEEKKKELLPAEIKNLDIPDEERDKEHETLPDLTEAIPTDWDPVEDDSE